MDTSYVFAWEEAVLIHQVSPLASLGPVTWLRYSDAPWIREAKENTVLWLRWQTDTQRAQNRRGIDHLEAKAHPTATNPTHIRCAMRD